MGRVKVRVRVRDVATWVGLEPGLRLTAMCVAAG